jgi:hypothetical protein
VAEVRRHRNHEEWLHKGKTHALYPAGRDILALGILMVRSLPDNVHFIKGGAVKPHFSTKLVWWGK